MLKKAATRMLTNTHIIHDSSTSIIQTNKKTKSPFLSEKKKRKRFYIQKKIISSRGFLFFIHEKIKEEI